MDLDQLAAVVEEPVEPAARSLTGSCHRPSTPKSTSAVSPGGGSATRTVTVGAPKPQWPWAKRWSEL
jgi:hypothetical protein